MSSRFCLHFTGLPVNKSKIRAEKKASLINALIQKESKNMSKDEKLASLINNVPNSNESIKHYASSFRNEPSIGSARLFSTMSNVLMTSSGGRGCSACGGKK